MRTGFTGWHILQEGMHYRRTCIREGNSHCLFVHCKHKQRSFIMSKCSFVLVWLTCLVIVIGVPPQSRSGASVIV